MKNTFKYFILLTTLCLIGCNKNLSNLNNENLSNKADDYTAKIDSLVKTITPRPFNGVILITQKGKIKYQRTVGYSNFETKTTFTINDRFRIQSNTKQITAVLILKEVEKGKIDLQSPIRKYLPDFKQTWADTVNVHHLLNMSSGIVSIEKPLAFRPGTDYYYSNPGYGLLGKIIEKVTGKTFTEVANTLFKDLEMHHTYCYEIDKPNEGLVNGYWLSKDTLNVVDFKSLNFTTETWANFIPTGGVISDVMDLNLWDKKLHKGKILKPATYQILTNSSGTGQHNAFGNEKLGYAYGLRISDATSVKYMGHAGRGIGFANIKFYVPSRDLSVIILENIYDKDDNIVYHFEDKIRQIIINSNLVK